MKKKVAAIGTFDGVHIGHMEVLRKVKEIAADRDLFPAVITFERHPLSLIAPERTPPSIIPIKKKFNLLRKEGLEPEIVNFTEEVRATTAQDWMTRMYEEMEVQVLVVGYDNTFGSDGVALNLNDYKRIGQKIGIEVVVAPVAEGISSSLIRKKIMEGDIEEANRMLGRSFTLSGKAVHGNKLGRTIGFPTANILPEEGMVLPAHGVYAAIATLDNEQKYPAMVNIGVRPTIRRSDTPTIETHIIGWDGDLYDKEVRLSFKRRLRDEIRFDSIEALSRQLEADKKAVLNSI